MFAPNLHIFKDAQKTCLWISEQHIATAVHILQDILRKKNQPLLYKKPSVCTAEFVVLCSISGDSLVSHWSS